MIIKIDDLCNNEKYIKSTLNHNNNYQYLYTRCSN